jgi:hypothetical protein
LVSVIWNFKKSGEQIWNGTNSSELRQAWWNGEKHNFFLFGIDKYDIFEGDQRYRFYYQSSDDWILINCKNVTMDAELTSNEVIAGALINSFSP